MIKYVEIIFYLKQYLFYLDTIYIVYTSGERKSTGDVCPLISKQYFSVVCISYIILLKNNLIIHLLFPHTERTESIKSYHASRLFNTTCHNTRIFLYKNYADNTRVRLARRKKKLSVIIAYYHIIIL